MAKKEKTPPPAEETKNEAASAEAAAPAPKSSKSKLIIIIVAAMLLASGGTFAALKFMGGGSPDSPAAETEESAPAAVSADGGHDGAPPIEAPKRGGAEGAAAGGSPEGGEAAEVIGPLNIEFKPFIVNLNDVGGKRFLKLSMSVEADTEALAAEINAKMPQFRDIILLLLSSLSYDDIATLDGKMRLRGQMLNRINTQLTSGKVRNVYFSEFVVQ